MKKIDWGSDEDFIQNYQELKSSRKMGELYGCDKTSVLNHAKKIGFDVKTTQTPKLTEQDKEDIRNDYNIYSSNELAEKYHVSRGMITKIWYDANLHGKTVEHPNTTKIDLTGQTFGYLTVLNETDKRDASGGIVWHCKCNNCGTEKDISGAELRNGRAISCGCIGRKNLELGRGLTKEEDKTGKRYGSLVVLKRTKDRVLNGRSYVNYLCQCDCGRQVEVLSSNLGSGNTQSCGKCNNNSHGNTKIDQLLTSANIPFIREYKFNTCKDVAPLPFDFYVNNSYLIEYDGKQHYDNKNTFFDSDTIRKHDKIKSQWCKEHNIPLIRIPYTKYNSLCLNDLLLETSSFVEK